MPISSGVADGPIGELGTGCGVGAAWVASALRLGVAYVSVEADAHLAAAARDLLRPVPAARVLHADWRALLPHEPFALLFVDVAEAKAAEAECVAAALRPGGIALLDDLTPPERWPPA